MIKIDIAGEVEAWMSSDEARTLVAEIFRTVLREELRYILTDDLVDSDEAARILSMSVGALRKAVERGRIPCLRIGRSLRFRRAELLQR